VSTGQRQTHSGGREGAGRRRTATLLQGAREGAGRRASGERDAVPDLGQDRGAGRRCSKPGPGRAPGRA
jgi:hypothetical protein